MVQRALVNEDYKIFQADLGKRCTVHWSRRYRANMALVGIHRARLVRRLRTCCLKLPMFGIRTYAPLTKWVVVLKMLNRRGTRKINETWKNKVWCIILNYNLWLRFLPLSQPFPGCVVSGQSIRRTYNGHCRTTQCRNNFAPKEFRAS